MKLFEKYGELYIKKLKTLHLSNCLEMFDRLNKPRNDYSYNASGCITRSQFAFMILEFACIPNKIEKSTAKSVCRSLLKEHTKEKITNKALYVLCSVVYKLLLEHAKEKRQKHSRKGYCRDLTSKILNSIVPQKKDGSPCYKVNIRVVECALSGGEIEKVPLPLAK